MRQLIALITVGALATFGAACDDNGDNGEASLAAYCALVADLDEQPDIPSAEQFEDLRQVAPEEIRDEVATASEAIEDEGENAFNDPDVVSAIEDIEAYEAESCDEADGDLDVDVEDEEDVDQDVDVDVDVEDETDGTTGTTDTTGDTDTTDTTEDDTTDTTEMTGTAPTTTADGTPGADSLY